MLQLQNEQIVMFY